MRLTMLRLIVAVALVAGLAACLGKRRSSTDAAPAAAPPPAVAPGSAAGAAAAAATDDEPGDAAPSDRPGSTGFPSGVSDIAIPAMP